MSKQCKVVLIRYPLSEYGDCQYQVAKTYNLLEPVVGVYISQVNIRELCADPTIEVEIEICGLKK
jgi:hypothetical protein